MRDGTPDSQPRKPQRHSRKKAFLRGRRVRKLLIEVAVAVVLLIVFFLFLRYLTQEPAASEESGAYSVDVSS